VEDDITQTQFLKAFPGIYTAWCYALLDCVEKVEDHMRLELEYCMKKLGWKRNVLLNAISRANTVVEGLDKEHTIKKGSAIAVKTTIVLLDLALLSLRASLSLSVSEPTTNSSAPAWICMTTTSMQSTLYFPST